MDILKARAAVCYRVWGLPEPEGEPEGGSADFSEERKG